MTENPELKKFGEQVRRLRILRDFSQEKLAERAGLHRNYIGGIERGERNIALLNILRLAKALGVSPSELLKEIE
ncbi:helix-turn-helix transcriptional regulator [Kamptonema sp. UHCC 0994]|uniref:helix-turn-helix domain-containing protein n=1 Tax=Kamptonema sp. UHCC 0994 TaxID=3031329 RepID=UPI0023B8F2F1|nr:helix-turn-helix transcriptional regulator [Kamptonema sp. UHCC 0994]MDF0554093.1 helix-turn-helix transcriptional regulator [Kamptonema sp. UHCC 0994]